jgi:hypothetical protein
LAGLERFDDKGQLWRSKFAVALRNIFE